MGSRPGELPLRRLIIVAAQTKLVKDALQAFRLEGRAVCRLNLPVEAKSTKLEERYRLSSKYFPMISIRALLRAVKKLILYRNDGRSLGEELDRRLVKFVRSSTTRAALEPSPPGSSPANHRRAASPPSECANTQKGGRFASSPR
jgi:hypothetical protein